MVQIIYSLAPELLVGREDINVLILATNQGILEKVESVNTSFEN